MALHWVRLDTEFPTNFKVMELVSEQHFRALFVYVSSLAHSGKNETDGFIAETWLPMIHGTPKIARELVDVGLWMPVPGGWEIPDWADYQPTSEESRARSAKARKAAEARWAKRKGNVTALHAVDGGTK